MVQWAWGTAVSWKLSLWGPCTPHRGWSVPRVRTLSAFYWTVSQYRLCSRGWPRTNNLPDISAAKVLTQSRQRIAIWDLQSWWAIFKLPHGKGRRMLLWGGKEAGRALVNKESTALNWLFSCPERGVFPFPVVLCNLHGAWQLPILVSEPGKFLFFLFSPHFPLLIKGKLNRSFLEVSFPIDRMANSGGDA